MAVALGRLDSAYRNAAVDIFRMTGARYRGGLKAIAIQVVFSCHADWQSISGADAGQLWDRW